MRGPYLSAAAGIFYFFEYLKIFVPFDLKFLIFDLNIYTNIFIFLLYLLRSYFIFIEVSVSRFVTLTEA